MTNDTGEPAPERRERAEARSNIFVVATIESAEACGPIRIRNMSAAGALIEGGVLPPRGSQVRVSRGSLVAHGMIAWQSGNRAGVRFDAAIAVADWLPGGSRTHQQKIDEVVYAYKSGAATPPTAEAASPKPKRATDLREELLELEQMLRRVAENLSQDMLVCDRHLTELQLIDVAAQKLAALAAIAK